MSCVTKRAFFCSHLKPLDTLKLGLNNGKQQTKIKKELIDDDNANEFKIKGELLTSYIYMIEKGMESVEVPNFYDDNYSNITIPLNKNLTPSENAQKYFTKYSKLKTAKIELTSQIAICNEWLQREMERE